MRPDMVRYFVMAQLGLAGTAVYDSNQPDSPNEVVTVYWEPGTKVSVHSTVEVIPYQAIIRVISTAHATGEARARTLYDAIQGLHNLKAYDGMYLAAAMDATTDPVTFAPDDNGGTPATKAASFNVNDYILIGSEILKVTGVTSPNVTASRAGLSTTKAIHADNTEVFNITRSPIPGELCDSCHTNGQGIIPMGLDEKKRWEFSVNWEVIVKP